MRFQSQLIKAKSRFQKNYPWFGRVMLILTTLRSIRITMILEILHRIVMNRARQSQWSQLRLFIFFIQLHR